MNDRYYAEYAERRTIESELIKLAEPHYLTQQNKFLDIFDKYHEVDCSLYNFQCKKFGNFLNLNIERNNVKFATTLNLMNVISITKFSGSLPNLTGHLRKSIYSTSTRDDGRCFQIKYRNHFLTLYKELYVYDLILNHRPMIVYPENSDNITYVGSYNMLIDKAAMDAKDDVITFKGIDVNIMCPFGKGDEVNNTILKELVND